MVRITGFKRDNKNSKFTKRYNGQKIVEGHHFKRPDWIQHIAEDYTFQMDSSLVNSVKSFKKIVQRKIKNKAQKYFCN